MSVNQYITFAASGGANVLGPTPYAADARRANGNVNGIADPQFCNTPWRQASVAVSALAQYIVDTTGTSMLDDGSVANFEAGLIAALGLTIKSALTAGVPIRNAKQTVTISATTANIDWSAGNYFVVLMNANLATLTFSNFPPSGVEQEITVDFVADGTDHGHAFLSESLLKWLGTSAGGTAPTFLFTSVGAVNTVVFKARDAVTTRVEAAYSGTSNA